MEREGEGKGEVSSTVFRDQSSIDSSREREIRKPTEPHPDTQRTIRANRPHPDTQRTIRAEEKNARLGFVSVSPLFPAEKTEEANV